jgi:hypothetical protein
VGMREAHTHSLLALRIRHDRMSLAWAARNLADPPQAIIAYMVQLFFAWRIFRLTSNFLVTLIIVLCSTIQMRPFLHVRASAAPH